VIDKMRTRNVSRPEMTWLEMDMLQLTFDDNFFDVVIDKATMDALMVDEGDVWNPNQSVIDSVDIMCHNMSRVLCNQGYFIQISFSQHHFRSKYLMGQRKSNSVSQPFNKVEGYCDMYKWNLKCHNIENNEGVFDYFCYVMQKQV
jgi:hypothetical protein